ncbi:cation/H(+) antiporter 4-like [Abrus precatorius]|uniref:Cation/H(+) antiporter 4-like n=1 Tax=Abrus precatorius TaxID=3816 RepID=A0A8B8MIK3_ABRPR|nr:cation/H(+) antiporter 4-like [Abrus precatorius]
MGTNNDTLTAIHRTIFVSAIVNETLSDPARKYVMYDVRVDMPPKIVSDGLWGNTAYAALPSRATLPLLELQIISIFTITQCFHWVLKRLGFPYFVSQIMAGFVLGPSLKIDALKPLKAMLFPYGSEDVLSIVSIFGYTFFLFLNGVKMDFSMITRTGKKAWTIALSSLLIPTFIGLTVCYKFLDSFRRTLGEFDGTKLPVVVIGHSGCSFPVVASLLSDLEILNSELGRLALSAALVMDVFTSFVTGFGTAIVSSLRTDSHDHDQNKGAKLAAFNATKYVGFLVMVITIARPTMRWIVRSTPEGRSVKKSLTYLVVLMALFSGLIGLNAKQTVLGGVLLVGLLVPEGPPLGTELIKQLELFTTWFLLPLFVTSCAMKVDISVPMDVKLIITVAVIIVVVHLLKLLITIGICRYCHMPKTDGLCLALMLSCKGVVDFCTEVFLFDSMLLSNQTVAMMTISVLTLGSIARIGVKSLYDPARKYAGYQKRNILNLKPNSELRVVACVHKPSHTVSIKNALDICCPTTNNPLVVHVLHLMELVGRSTPVFIAHRLQERVGSDHHNFSEDVIVTFDLFEHDNAGTASVNTYTAISPSRFMHDDICYLALDKLASIIILPFHVRWAEDGSIESTDENIRALNNKVLERAPCSVGILVNRGSSSYHGPTKNIAMIFLGGSDDREALCLAKRTIKDCGYNMAVYHLVASNSGFTNWDVMLDDEVLKSVKGTYGNVENVTYEKIIIEDPSQTTDFLTQIANLHDFIIVGRRNGIKSSQTAALESWTEFSELGVVGDLLASPDTTTKASILVVQQQQTPKS